MSLKISLCFGKVGKHYFAFSNLCTNINWWIISLFLWGGGCVWVFLLVEVQRYAGRQTDLPKASQWHSWDEAWMGPQKSLSASLLFQFVVLPQQEVWRRWSTMQSMQLFSSSRSVFSGEIQSCCNTSLSLFRTFVQSVYKQEYATELKVYLGSRGNGTSSSERSLQRESE